MGIAVIGSVFIDIKGYPLAPFIPGGRNVGRVVQVHGGVCRNIVEDIANVELQPMFVSLVDDTGLGEDIVKRLRKHKVDTRFVRRTPDGMGTWLAIFDNSGDVAGSISKRPDLLPILDILNEHGDEIFSAADSIVVEIDIEIPILKKILQLADQYQKPVYAPVSNMSIAVERRDLLKRIDCFVCNLQEAGILFSEDFENLGPQEMEALLPDRLQSARIPRIVVTMGPKGAVYAELNGSHGFCPSLNVDVIDTTGAGDSFFAGVAIGLTYGKTLPEACEIGARLAGSVITTRENVSPRFLPEEFGIRRE